jgi:hypothetical protein
MSTKIVKGFPPNIDELRARFNPPPGTVFAYGDTIYSPANVNLSADLIAHETTHFAQQARSGGPEAWWRRYIDDPQFRLEQELEAYRAQYATLTTLPRPERRALLAHYCKSLASSMYGGIVTKEQARKLIAGPA